MHCGKFIFNERILEKRLNYSMFLIIGDMRYQIGVMLQNAAACSLYS